MKNNLLDKLHRKIYLNLKRQCDEYQGYRSKELSSYQKAKKHYAHKKFTLCSPGKLNAQIKKAKIIYLGDFHTFDHNIKNVERILKYLLAQNLRPALAVEFIRQGMEDEIYFFLKGYITELEFLEAINYQESWKFPWEHYRIFFRYARKYQLTILPLNTPGPLQKRDQRAAQSISSFLDKYPDTTLIVFFGELHIMPSKLPRLVQQLTPAPFIIIHQNIDEIYWSISSTKRPGSILQFSNSEFALLSSPPWIKYESLLYWYENIVDDPDFDLKQSTARNLTASAHEQFLELSKLVASFLNLPPWEFTDDFSLYDYRQLSVLWKKLQKINDPSVLKFYYRLIAKSQLFIAPFGNLYYCSNYSINRFAYLVGIHLFHTYQKKAIGEWPLYPWPRRKYHKFSCFYYQFYLAYLTSKIINPHRKCLMYQDLKNSSRYQVAREIIDHPLATESIISNKGLDIYYQAAQLIGHFAAELSFHQSFFPLKHSQESWVLMRTEINRILSLPIHLADFPTDLQKILDINSHYPSTKKRIF